MRILQVINSAHPRGGGPIEAVLQAARAVAELGHETEIASVDDPSAPWLQKMPVKIHALGPAVTPYRYSSQFIPWLERHARNFDCAIVNGIWLFPSYATWKVLTRQRVPYFVYSHGLLDPAHHRVFPVRRLKKMLSWVATERRVLDDADAVFFTCEEERAAARISFRPRQRRDNGVILPYCVGQPPGDPDQQIGQFLDRFSNLKDLRRLLFLSRIHPKKGLDILIQAFAQVADRDPELHLVIAGAGEPAYAESLRELARNLGVDQRLTWTGMLQGDLKWGAFRSAEVFALPSHHENYGIAVVEAIACGTPVIISQAINIYPELHADRAAILCRDNVETTVTALNQWLDLDPDARQEARLQARACYEQRFSVDASRTRLLQTLESFGVKDRSRAWTEKVSV